MVQGIGWKTEKVSLRITGIKDGTELCLRVRLEKTGKWTTISRRLAEVFPGRVIIPLWLAKRILSDHHEKPVPDMPPAA